MAKENGNSCITKVILVFMLIVLVTICARLESQTPKNAVYVSFQPADFGWGMRVDHQFENVGIYGSISYGNGGIYKQNYLSNHVKLSTGILVPISRYTPENLITGYKFFTTVGINYHSIGEYTNANNDYLNPKIFNPWSFELGITAHTWHMWLFDHVYLFTIGLRTDIIRWEPGVDIGLIHRF